MSLTTDLRSIANGIRSVYSFDVSTLSLFLNDDVELQWEIDGQVRDQFSLDMNVLALLYVLLYGRKQFGWASRFQEDFQSMTRSGSVLIHCADLPWVSRCFDELNAQFGGLYPEIAMENLQRPMELLVEQIERDMEAMIQARHEDEPTRQPALLDQFRSAEGTRFMHREAVLIAKDLFNSIGVRVELFPELAAAMS